MNVEINTKTEVTTQICNGNCKVALVNGEVTSIKVQSGGGSIEFGTKLVEFEQFLQNCIDVYHSVVLEQIDERRRAEGIDSPAGQVS